jgi:hypothetical protein
MVRSQEVWILGSWDLGRSRSPEVWILGYGLNGVIMAKWPKRAKRAIMAIMGIMGSCSLEAPDEQDRIWGSILKEPIMAHNGHNDPLWPIWPLRGQIAIW